VAGDAAVVLPPNDSRAWADAMLQVVTDSHRADALRLRGFVRAKAFSWERAAQATREVYREALLA
jgi:glycosyltransferase involved in cell wall biosynthesis